MSRKDAWKKELGISEYPWSSDDDDDDSNTRGSPHLPEPPAPRSRLNGTSDPTLASSSRKVLPTTQSHGQSRATNKALSKKVEDTSLSAINRLKSSSSAPVTNGASSSRKAPPPAGTSSSSAVKKAQDKKDRDSFWAAVNGPNRYAAMASLSRSRENPSRSATHAGPSRSSSTQSLSRTALSTPSTSLSRSHTQPLHTSLSTSAMPGGSGRHTDLQKLIETRNVMLNRYLEATKKSTANLVSISRILLKAKRRSRTRNGTTTSRTEDRSSLYVAPGTGSAALPAPLALLAPPATSISIDHSDDELRLPTFSFDESEGQDEGQGSQRGASDAPALALEEIVEIETEADTSLATEAETSAETVDAGGAGSSAQVTTQQNGSNDGASQAHGVKRKRDSDDEATPSSVKVLNQVTAQPSDANEGTSQPQGVKRKRDSDAVRTSCNPDDDDDEHSPVKEFNQSLLKLLECPVCLESMAPPLAQCRRGHLVCGRCRARLAACPVCRAAFSSVRNRAMEGVADMVWYPCRHCCGRSVRLRERATHEASCASRRHRCPAPACAARPMRRRELPAHAQSKHLSIMRLGKKHDLSLQLNAEERRNLLVYVYGEMFHVKLDVDVRTWGLMLYVTYMGPYNEACKYSYQVVVTGQYNSRKLVYSRETHCDLESSALTISRQDCFHMTLDQAINFLRVRNKPCEPNQTLNLTVEIIQSQTPQDDAVKLSDVQ